MKYFLALFLISSSVFSQAFKFKSIEGEIKILPVFHSSLVIEVQNKTLFIDPYGGIEKYTSFPNPDIVLITHSHGDHLDMSTLSKINIGDAILIAPVAVVNKIGELSFKNIINIGNDESIVYENIKIEAIPMYNFSTDVVRHKKGEGNGYILNVDGLRIYIAGDTEGIPEMLDLKNIDIAFIPMNLPYTMDVNQAAKAVIAFKPKTVFPYHFRGANNIFSDVELFKKLVNESDKSIDVIIADWYPENK